MSNPDENKLRTKQMLAKFVDKPSVWNKNSCPLVSIQKVIYALKVDLSFSKNLRLACGIEST